MKVSIPHIDPDGPEIEVSQKRLDRIMILREKRRIFLQTNPEFRVPYKKRPQRRRDHSRSKVANSKERGPGGQFVKKDSPRQNRDTEDQALTELMLAKMGHHDDE